MGLFYIKYVTIFVLTWFCLACDIKPAADDPSPNRKDVDVSEDVSNTDRSEQATGDPSAMPSADEGPEALLPPVLIPVPPPPPPPILFGSGGSQGALRKARTGNEDESCDDMDRDSVCDALDRCPGFNDLLDEDQDGSPTDCDCDDSNANIFQGGPCVDDSNECTRDICDPTGSRECFHQNLFQGTPCGDPSDGECDHPDTCDGSGVCQTNLENMGTLCGDTGTECVVQDLCDDQGNCVDNGFVQMGTSCGDQSDTECNNPDSCDGAGTCLDNFEMMGSMCGDTGTECIVQDTCDSMGSCTDNGFVQMGSACGDNTDTDCDNPDTCDGMGTCLSNLEMQGFMCGDQSDTECTDPDTCDDMGTCLDNHVAADTPCGDMGELDSCDLQDTCDGMGTCQSLVQDSSFVCREAADACDPEEMCDGMSTSCPPDVTEDTTDTDSDSVYDCLDNCPIAYNPMQEDVDSNDIGDLCQNCPQADSSGTDVDQDLINDPCDCDDQNPLIGAALGLLRFVDPAGDDTANDCLDEMSPCQTIAHAMSEAQAGDSIILSDDTFHENLLFVDKDLWFSGQGPDVSIVDGGNEDDEDEFPEDRIFTVLGGVTASFCRMQISHGFDTSIRGFGSGITSSGDVTISMCRFFENSNQNGAAQGGAIYNEGAMSIVNTTFESNVCEFNGGTIHNGTDFPVTNDPLDPQPYLFMRNCTISNSGSGFEGGGLYNDGIADIFNTTFSGAFGSVWTPGNGGAIANRSRTYSNGPVTIAGQVNLTNVTISGSLASLTGSAINNDGILNINNSTISQSSGAAALYTDTNGVTNVYHSIVANQNTVDDCAQAVTSSSYSLESGTSCNFVGTGDLQSTDPMLIALADNGGFTETYALPSDSPAVDAGDTDCGVTEDQRESPRPIDVVGTDPIDNLPRCDIGSYELNP